MAITEQARAQANKIVSDIRVSVLTDVYWNDVAERITTAIEAAHVHPASLTDAIEAVKRYAFYQAENKHKYNAANEIVELLESLQGKAPVGECKGCGHALTEYSGYACNICGHRCKSWSAATTPSSGEVPK